MQIKGGDHFDHYVIESVLGRGGMGVVYRATDINLGRPVALKVLAPEVAEDPGFRGRFEQEARLAASLDEPHVIPVYEVGVHGGQPFLAMRYVAGPDLGTLLARAAPLAPARAVDIVEQVALALDAAHDAGLIHRDVKPANVLVSSTAHGADHVYLGDFGLALSAAGGSERTRPGQILGSLQYVAPEQIEGRSLDRRADVYALGGVLYTCLTGRPPFEAASEAALLYAQLNAAPPAPTAIRPELPRGFDNVVAKAMAKERDQRFTSAGELAKAARAAVSAMAPSIKAERSATVEQRADVRKSVTVLFTDLVDSTVLGERLDPEALRSLFGLYFDAIRAVVEEHGGTVEKFIGDAAMAVFGVPLLHEDDALRAVRTALEIGRRIEDLNAGPAGRLGVRLAVRSAINSGEVVAGDPSTGQAMVTGDAVNTAARLQQAANPGEVLIDESTYRLVRHAVLVQARDPVIAKGKVNPLTVYAVQGLTTPTAVGPSGESPLVGRDGQVALILDRWRRVTADRQPRLVTLVGAAGIGKSRLVASVRELVDGQVLTGHCLSYGQAITYWPVREIVSAAAHLPESDTAASALARVTDLFDDDPQAAMLAERVATCVGLTTADVPQAEVFWAVRRLLEQVARRHPTMVVFEDLGWAEDTLLDLIDYIVDLASDAPLLLIATARPEVLDRRPGWSSAGPNAELIRLEALDKAQADELVRTQSGGIVLPVRLVRRICEAAEGNPLFIEELVGMLRDAGELHLEGAQWVFVGTHDAIEIPPTIRTLLAARVDRLAPAEKLVAERASVVGRNFESAAVVALLPSAARASLPVELRALIRRELLQPDRSELTPTDAFRFRHILIRDAAYESLPKSLRAELHKRFVDWLVDAAGDRRDEYAEIVGYHLEQSYGYLAELAIEDGRDDTAARAGEFLTLAARRADSRGDLAAAAKLLRRALALPSVDADARASAMLLLGHLQQSLGEFAAARRTLNEALSTAARSGNDMAIARAELEIALVDVQDPEEANLERDRRTLAGIGLRLADGDDAARALWRMAEGAMLEFEGRNGAAASSFKAALEHAAQRPERRAQAESISRLIYNQVLGETTVPVALAECEGVLNRWQDWPRLVASVLDSYALLLAMADRFEEARLAEQRSLQICAELDDRPREGVYRAQGLAVILSLAGRLIEAESEARRGCALLERAGARAWLSTAASIMGEIEFALSRTGEAGRWLQAAQGWSVESDVDAVVRAHVLGGRLAAATGDGRRARELIDRAVAVAEPTELLYLRGIAAAGRACVLTQAGMGAEAARLAAHAREIHERKGDVARARRADTLLRDPERWQALALI